MPSPGVILILSVSSVLSVKYALQGRDMFVGKGHQAPIFLFCVALMEFPVDGTVCDFCVSLLQRQAICSAGLSYTAISHSSHFR